MNKKDSLGDRMKTTNIYTLTDPITNEVRYVGKTNSISQRYKAHLNKARKHQAHKLNWINSLKKKGLKPIIEVIDIVPVEDWRFWEKYWISQIKTWGFNLVNYTDGGDGLTFGNQTSFKVGDKGKPVIVLDLSGKIIEEFISARQARKKYGTGVSSVLSGRRKTQRGFIFKYKDDFDKSKIEEYLNYAKTYHYTENSGQYKKGQKSSTCKKVNMYDLNWKFIRSFDSAKDAGEFMNVTGGAIQSACRVNKNNVCKKFKFKYCE